MTFTPRTWPLLACIALAACATDPAAVTAEAPTENCASRETPTGTMIVKREPCIVMTEAERAEARRRAEAMRQEQSVIQRGIRAGQVGN